MGMLSTKTDWPANGRDETTVLSAESVAISTYSVPAESHTFTHVHHSDANADEQCDGGS